MTVLRVALAQVNTTVGDLGGNVRKIAEAIGRARSLGADVVALPELAIPGYPPEDLALRPQFVSDNRLALDEVIATCAGLTCVVGFIDSREGLTYNAAAVIFDRKLIDVYHKHLLPNYGVFDERRYFAAGDSHRVFDIGGAGVSVSICEDIWHADGPASVQASRGARLIINVNGSPFHRGKQASRESMLSERARQTGAAIAYVNMVGGQDELVFDGGSVVMDSSGKVLARAPMFEEALMACDIPLDELPSDRRAECTKICGPTAPAAKRKPLANPSICPVPGDTASVYSALVTGTRDYAKKCGFDRAVVAMSGGIDSSLVAAIAVDALGADSVVGIAMPSRYSSEASFLDAQSQAEALGMELLSTPIEQVFSAYLETLTPALGEAGPDVTEENLQARIRGNVVMAMSNRFRYLALATGNKSEYATGFATLYGDMSGGFAVIKDVPKTLVYDLCRFRNTITDVIPQSVITKPPTAELRPDQLDTDALPPYEVLDPILAAYVEDDLSYGEMVAMGHPPDTVRRVISLVDRAEYKRRQGPPGVKITERNFGRDRRMPIVNGYRPYWQER